MPNRVDTNDDQYPAMNRYRMKTITTESGGKIDITRSEPASTSARAVGSSLLSSAVKLRCARRSSLVARPVFGRISDKRPNSGHSPDSLDCDLAALAVARRLLSSRA